MILLPSLPGPSPLSSCSSTSCSLSAKLWLSDALLMASSDLPPTTPSAASTYGTEGLCRAQQSLLISSGTCGLGLPFVSLSSLASMAPSVRCSPNIHQSHKRLRKGLEFSNCRSLQHTQIFDLRLRVSAVSRHGRFEQSGLELELIADEDRLRQTKAPLKMKSAEELHFEAIEAYCLRYENKDYACFDGDGSIVDVQADSASSDGMHSPALGRLLTPADDVVNTPINESKYLDASRALPLTGFKENTVMQTSPLIGKQERWIRSIGTKLFATTNENGNDGGPKNTPLDSGNAQLPEASQRRGSVRKIMGKESVGAASLDNFHQQKTLDEDVVPQVDECQFQDKGSESGVDSPSSREKNELSEDQKIRMELNKAAALARRNMRMCEDAVAEARAKGLAFPKFETLLIEKSWVEVLRVEFQKPYMERLHHFVSQEAAGKVPIYPPPAKVFNAFNSCPLDKVKVVIIGQDPYHGPGQAMGLCFSVENGIKLPSSLTNIFLEIQSDLNCDFPTHGNLEKWAHQGVLLLNTVLTVRDRHANSHAKKGWELFTDAAIRTLAQQRSGVVFLLWGNQAQEKLRLITKTSHHILKAFHPSGISAHRGFFNCRHFSKTNQLLVDQGLLPIDWQL